MSAKENSAGGGAPAEFGRDALLRNKSTLPQNVADGHQRSRITSLAPHPSRPDAWLLSIDGSSPFAVRDSKLRSAKRVVNIASYQGVLIVDMPDQAAWAAMLAQARQGGAA
jgi:hypothetical protein